MKGECLEEMPCTKYDIAICYQKIVAIMYISNKISDFVSSFSQDKKNVLLHERIFAEISNTVVGSDYDEKVEMAKKMTIRSCRQLGRYNRNRARPISCEFVHPEDVSYIIENRNYLQEGIFVDYEYPAEIERKRRLLLPILRAA